MKVDLIGLLSETSMHPGTESSTELIDLPVAREVTTSYPVLVGSSLKGAFRESFEDQERKEKAEIIFGKQNQAGDVAITDGRLLLLPIRTMVGHYRWITCPYIIDRLFRDLKLAGYEVDQPQLPEVEKGKAIYKSQDKYIFLEEITFAKAEGHDLIEELAPTIAPFLYHKSLKERLTGQLTIISDSEFAYFAKYGLEVRARNKLSDGTKTSENLWYEENLPADTLFYTLFLSRTGENSSLKKLKECFQAKPYIQIGGNETIGQGWCALSWWEEGGR